MVAKILPKILLGNRDLVNLHYIVVRYKVGFSGAKNKYCLHYKATSLSNYKYKAFLVDLLSLVNHRVFFAYQVLIDGFFSEWNELKSNGVKEQKVP